MSKKKTYPLSASQFVQWCTHASIAPRVIGIIEHEAHHRAVMKYQSAYLSNQQTEQVLAVGEECEQWMNSENMPDIVRKSQLVISETKINHVHLDLYLNGRIDQLYKFGDWHFLVDTKSHQEATFADQLQLSFYAFILMKNGYKIAPFAFIRSIFGGVVRYQEIDTIPENTILEIISEID